MPATCRTWWYLSRPLHILFYDHFSKLSRQVIFSKLLSAASKFSWSSRVWEALSFSPSCPSRCCCPSRFRRHIANQNKQELFWFCKQKKMKQYQNPTHILYIIRIPICKNLVFENVSFSESIFFCCWMVICMELITMSFPRVLGWTSTTSHLMKNTRTYGFISRINELNKCSTVD